MAFKDPEGIKTIYAVNGRCVSSTTKWWLEKSPKAYRYYCIHSELLTKPCSKCEREVGKLNAKNRA